MKLLTINQGVVTLQLSPEQCVDLAQSADFAARHSYDGQTETWQTQAALLQACAVAACAQWHMDPEDEQAVETNLARLGLIGMTAQAEREYAETSPVIQALLSESCLEGQRQATLAALRRTVDHRFGPASAPLDPRLDALDWPVLEQLAAVALTALTFAEFEAACQSLL